MNRSGSREGRTMQEIRLLEAIFELVACWSKSEMTNSARKLLIEYYRTCPEETAAGRARGAIRRYAQWDPPSLGEIRERHRAGAMEDLDWRILKVENEARKLDEADGRA